MKNVFVEKYLLRQPRNQSYSPMKILMVCLGNICRSPLAEGIMKQKIQKHNLDWQVDSAGTISYHEGETPDLRSIEVAQKHGLDITGQRSRPLQLADFNNFDLILQWTVPTTKI